MYGSFLAVTKHMGWRLLEYAWLPPSDASARPSAGVKKSGEYRRVRTPSGPGRGVAARDESDLSKSKAFAVVA